MQRKAHPDRDKLVAVQGYSLSLNEKKKDICCLPMQFVVIANRHVHIPCMHVQKSPSQRNLATAWIKGEAEATFPLAGITDTRPCSPVGLLVFAAICRENSFTQTRIIRAGSLFSPRASFAAQGLCCRQGD